MIKQKMVTPKKRSKKWLPQKVWRTLLRGGLLLNFGKSRTLFCWGLLLRFEHYGSEVGVLAY